MEMMNKYDLENELENLRQDVYLAGQRLNAWRPIPSDFDDEFACYLDRTQESVTICNLEFKPSEILWKCNRDLYEEEQAKYVAHQFKVNPMQFEMYAILRRELMVAASELQSYREELGYGD